MRETRYLLRTKSAAWRARRAPHEGDRLTELLITVERGGVPLGGNNIQLVAGAPDRRRSGLNEDVVMWLDSGWWLTLRNQFADAPHVAAEILASAADRLSELTDCADRGGRPGDGDSFWQQIRATTIVATGPDYWPGGYSARNAL